MEKPTPTTEFNAIIMSLPSLTPGIFKDIKSPMDLVSLTPWDRYLIAEPEITFFEKK